jgi:tape measure domain-containing protein
MTTITALNVRLGMDVSNFSEGANLAKAEVTKVASIMRQSVPPAEKYKQEVDLLNRAFSDAGKRSADYANAMDMLAKKHQQGRYSAEEVAKAEAALAQKAVEAAAATKRLKEEAARLADEQRKQAALMERGRQLTQSLETTQQSHNRRLKEYRELLKGGAIDQETFNTAVKNSTTALKQSQVASSGMMSSIKGLVASYVGFQAVTKSLKLAMQVEDAAIAFETLTGSAADGALLFKQIRDFAAASPVTFTNAADATKTMMSFGLAAQDMQKNLQMLSDITGGNNERFKSLALAFSQMSASGRLMGQDLLQMINVGFNPLQQISKTTGESMVELKKRMEAGAISADEVRQAFIDATSEGGMFHGMTERLSKTVSGKLNIALSDLEQKLAKAGEAMGPVLLQILDTVTRLEPVLKAVINLIDGIAEGLGFAIAALSDLVSSITNFKVDTTEINKFLDMIEQKERDRAKAAREQVAQEFQQKKAVVNQVAIAERKAAQELAATRAEAMVAQRKAMEEAWKQQQKNIERERAARLKAIEDARKAQEQARMKAEQEFQRELEAARADAMRFFDEQKQANDKRREDVARGPGSGMEAGSQDAVKFAADQINRSIAKAAVPDDPVILQRDIAKKTAELLLAQREANRLQAIQTELAKEQLIEMQNNGFRRIR